MSSVLDIGEWEDWQVELVKNDIFSIIKNTNQQSTNPAVREGTKFAGECVVIKIMDEINDLIEKNKC